MVGAHRPCVALLATRCCSDSRLWDASGALMVFLPRLLEPWPHVSGSVMSCSSLQPGAEAFPAQFRVSCDSGDPEPLLVGHLLAAGVLKWRSVGRVRRTLWRYEELLTWSLVFPLWASRLEERHQTTFFCRFLAHNSRKCCHAVNGNSTSGKNQSVTFFCLLVFFPKNTPGESKNRLLLFTLYKSTLG